MKKTLLALTGAVAIRLSSDRKAALDFVDRRIDDVMRFEKWKATTKVRPGHWLADAAQALGRARYGRPPPRA